MDKYAKDCNSDGVIDCADYAAIHKAGAGHCEDHWVHKSAFMQSFFALSGRNAEASEMMETIVPFADPFHADLRDFRRVVTRRNRPTPVPRRRNIPADPVHDMVSALGPWVIDAVTGLRRGNRRPGNDPVQPPRRRRPQAATAAPPATARPTQPHIVINPTRRRFRPVGTTFPVTPVPRSTPRLETRPPSTRAPAPTIPSVSISPTANVRSTNCFFSLFIF